MTYKISKCLVKKTISIDLFWFSVLIPGYFILLYAPGSRWVWAAPIFFLIKLSESIHLAWTLSRAPRSISFQDDHIKIDKNVIPYVDILEVRLKTKDRIPERRTLILKTKNKSLKFHLTEYEEAYEIETEIRARLPNRNTPEVGEVMPT